LVVVVVVVVVVVLAASLGQSEELALLGVEFAEDCRRKKREGRKRAKDAIGRRGEASAEDVQGAFIVC